MSEYQLNTELAFIDSSQRTTYLPTGQPVLGSICCAGSPVNA